MSFKQHQPLKNSDRKRLIGVAIFVLALFSLLIMQFYKIQMIEGDKWTHEANKQHYFIVKEPFQRGKFLSNTAVKKGHLETEQSFVVDIKKYHLYIDPVAIPAEHRDSMVNYLLNVLDLTVQEQLAFRSQFDLKSRSRKLAMWLDFESQEEIMKWWQPYARKNKIARNALFFVADYQRSYPFGKQLGQVLHTIQSNKDELTQQAIPTGGLELYFNGDLKGKLGKRRLMRSPRNSLETGEVISQPENGADIYLTINHCLQAIAEEEIAKGVRKCKARAGWAIMMNPHTGEILALAQYPFFHPPDYQNYFNDPKRIEDTRVKAITDANEPGSVMKPITVAIALKANEVLRARGQALLFDPLEMMATSNGSFPGRKKPITDTTMHYYLDMQMALQKSSNIYVSRLVERIINRLGKEWYRNELNKTFGFGEKTHIELPAESRGVLPAFGKVNVNGTLEWSTATPFSMAFGHNLQCTSLQLLRAWAVFANGGYFVQPTLVRKIVKGRQDGSVEVLLDHTLDSRQEQFPHVLSHSISKDVTIALKFVTKVNGTSRRGDVWGYTEAGKSSTAKKIVNGAYSEVLYCSHFVGFAPAENPAFILLVGMDEPEYGYIPGIGKNHHGGTCAAPVFSEISRRSLEYLGIPPDDPHGYPSQDPRFDRDKADWHKEIRLLQEKYEKWNKKG